MLNVYLLFMFIAFAPLRWTIEIVNIFADNTVTVTRGTGIGDSQCSYKQKNVPRQAAKCPENTLVALETPLRVGQADNN